MGNNFVLGALAIFFRSGERILSALSNFDSQILKITAIHEKITGRGLKFDCHF